MAADCGHELRRSNVAMVSLWPGPVKTEYIQDKLMSDPKNPMGSMFAKGETIEFAGKAIVHLAADSGMMAKTGKILNTADLAKEYSFTENDGTLPIDFRLAEHLSLSQYHDRSRHTLSGPGKNYYDTFLN